MKPHILQLSYVFFFGWWIGAAHLPMLVSITVTVTFDRKFLTESGDQYLNYLQTITKGDKPSKICGLSDNSSKHKRVIFT